MSKSRSLRLFLQFGDKDFEPTDGAVLDLVHGVTRKAEIHCDELRFFAADGDTGKDFLGLGLHARVSEKAPQGDFVGGLLPSIDGEGGFGG